MVAENEYRIMTQGSLTTALRETLALFSPGTPQTTTEVADQLELGRRSTYERLERLVAQDRLRTKKAGAHGRVWWQPPVTGATDSPDWPAAAESLIDDVLDGAEVGVFVLDEDFDVVWINQATERYFGLDRERVVGREKRTLVEEQIAARVEDSEAFADTVLATYDDNTYTERFECRVEGGNGREERWLEHRSRPIESGAYAGGRVELYYDVTDRKETEAARKSDRAEFESLVAAVDEYAIFTLDTEGYVQTWNPGARRIKGYDEDEITGEHFSTFYTEDVRAADVPARNLERAAREGSVEDEGWRVRADGSRFWSKVTITAIRDEGGQLQGFAKITHDVTDRREREQQLRRERDLIERVLETVPVGVGVVSSEGEILRVNERSTDLLGIVGDDIVASEISDYELYDADGSPISQEERPITRVIKTGNAVREQQYQIEHPDGERRWLSVHAAPLEDEEGRVDRVVAVGEDVSQLREQANRLERQRDDLEAELAEVLDRVDDGFFALDTDLRFTHVNDRAADFLRRSAGELLGEHIWDALEPGPKAEVAFEDALETGESVSFAEYYDQLETWFEHRIYPSETGLSVYFRDVTERKQRERDLERYETVVETISDGVYVADEQYRFTMVNDAYVEMTGYDRDELLGSHVSTVVDSDTVQMGEQRRETLRSDSANTGRAEVDIETRDGDSLTVESRYSELPSDDGFRGTAGIVQDITGRVEREHELERQRELLRHSERLAGTGGWETNVETGDQQWTQGLFDMHDMDVDEPDQELVPTAEEYISMVAPEHRDAFRDTAERCMTEGEPYDEEIPVTTAADRERWIRTIGVPIFEDGEIVTLRGAAQDITERKERERELEEYRRWTQTLMENFPAGAVAVVDEDLQYVTFGGEPEGETRLSRHDLAGEDVREVLPEQIANVVAPAYEDALDGTSSEFEETIDDRIYQFHFVPVRDDDGEVFAATAMSQEVTQRVEHERQLERQRERLAALNNLNDIVREITEAVIDQSTREEIEETVCERLAESESYTLAWIGDVDKTTERLTFRTQAGVDGYLDDVSITVDPDDPHSDGPGGRALRTGEIKTANDLTTDARVEPWRKRMNEYGFGSSAGIPIVHEGTTYGVLGLYSDRPNAFIGDEREVIAQLGEIVGHAIAAAERKQALMSDELVELDFHVASFLGDLGVAISENERVTLDHSVPLDDGEFLVYGTATEGAIDAVHEIVEALEYGKSVEFHDDGTPASFEVRMTDPPVLSVVASLGGYVEELFIEDGDLDLRVHLAPSVDVRNVIDTVTDTYPTAEMRRRRQITRSAVDRRRVQRELVADLTDKQRTALEAAYRSGFFEWPRDASGEDVAESLGVAPPTYHQHLRKAERKVFDAVFCDGQVVG